METGFATRQDIADLRHEVEQRFERVEARVDQLDTKIETVKDELKSQIVQSEQRMIIKLGTIVSVAIGVAVMLARLAG